MLFLYLFILKLYNGHSMNVLVSLKFRSLFFRCSVNLPWQGFPASSPIGHYCVCSPLLFTSAMVISQHTVNRGWKNEPEWALVGGCVAWKPKCTMTSCWMGSLGFVYGLLIGNCRYQTNRKKDLWPKWSCIPLVIVMWQRELQHMYFTKIAYNVQCTMYMISILQIRIFARKNNKCGSKDPISKKNIKVSSEVEY